MVGFDPSTTSWMFVAGRRYRIESVKSPGLTREARLSPVLFVGTNVVEAGLPLEGFDGRRVWLVRKIKRASEM
jgi:hypothetical protein